jgi:hypothetical protein
MSLKTGKQYRLAIALSPGEEEIPQKNAVPYGTGRISSFFFSRNSFTTS